MGSTRRRSTFGREALDILEGDIVQTVIVPVTSVFKLQRNTIESGQQVFERSLDLPRNLATAFQDSFDAQDAAQRRTLEFGQTSTHTVLDTVEQALPGSEGSVDEIREAVDEGFDTLGEQHGQAFDAIDEQYTEGVQQYDELTADSREAINGQIEFLLETNEDVEARTLETFEQLVEEAE
jgi:hypothetical protein